MKSKTVCLRVLGVNLLLRIYDCLKMNLQIELCGLSRP